MTLSQKFFLFCKKQLIVNIFSFHIQVIVNFYQKKSLDPSPLPLNASFCRFWLEVCRTWGYGTHIKVSNISLHCKWWLGDFSWYKKKTDYSHWRMWMKIEVHLKSILSNKELLIYKKKLLKTFLLCFEIFFLYFIKST